jgi:polysaccharide biosynthesis protein PslG
VEYGEPTSLVDENSQAALISDYLNTWSQFDYAGPAFIYTTRDRETGSTNNDDTYGVLRSDWTRKPAAHVIQQWTATHPQTAPGAVTPTASSTTVAPMVASTVPPSTLAAPADAAATPTTLAPATAPAAAAPTGSASTSTPDTAGGTTDAASGTTGSTGDGTSRRAARSADPTTRGSRSWSRSTG